MHGHYVRARKSARKPKQVRDMHQSAIETLEDGAALEVTPGSGIGLKQRDRLKVGWERSDFRHFFGRTDQKIFVLMVQPGKRPYDVARVGSDAKLGHAPDIDGYLHERI